jgi:hypothetical protein
MRQCLSVVAMVTVVMLALATGAQRSVATQMCSTMCSGGATLSCSASTTCTSTSGTIVCCGTTHTCSAYNTWQACSLTCLSREQQCFHSCTQLDPCFPDCVDTFNTCKSGCGSEPPLNFSC